jgi:DNA-binding MarR family transcriptional regulator
MPTATKTPPDTSTAYEQFEFAWDEFMVSVRRARGRAASAPGGLTSSQFHLLDALDRGTARTVGELAEAAGVTPPTATRMLDVLEREGVVERGRDEADRRVVAITLTPAGRKRVRARRSLIAKRRRMVFDALTAEERRRGAQLLHRLAEVMDHL